MPAVRRAAVSPMRRSQEPDPVAAVTVDTAQESHLLARAGFEAVPSSMSFDGETTVDPRSVGEVAVSDLAVRVLRAAECLDDPTTSLLANLDTLLEDLRDGSVGLEEVQELVQDCVSAVSTLATGLERIKGVAAPHTDVVDHTGTFSIDLALRDAVGHLRAAGGGPAVQLPAITGLRAHGDRASVVRAFSDLLEVFASRLRQVAGGHVCVSVVRGKDRLAIVFTDGEDPFPAHAADLLSGRARAGSQEGLALLAARSFLEAVGGEVRVGRVAGKGAIQVHLRAVD